MKRLIMLAVVVAITGCSTQEKRLEKYITEAHPTCVKISATQEVYDACMTAAIQDRERERRARNAAIGAALSGAGKHCSGGKTVGPYGVYVPNC